MTAAIARGRSAPPRRVRLDFAGVITACVADGFLFGALPSAGFRPVAALGLTVVAVVALLFRWREPLIAFAVVLAQFFVYALVLAPSAPLLPLLLVLHAVAARRSVSAAVACGVIALAGYAPVSILREATQSPQVLEPAGLVGFLGLFGILFALPIGVGRWNQRARSQIDDLERRRQEAATEAAAAERRLIARELHDIVSHSVSVMVLQAAGARKMLDRNPARAGEALQQIEQVGKASMAELRRLLGVLRDGSMVDSPSVALGPDAGLARLEQLVAEMRTGGLNVQVEHTGVPGWLDFSLDLSAYRIVQEALTNVAKHAGDTTLTRVGLTWEADRLVIDVTNTGTDHTVDPALSLGQGLAGLKERTRAFGGEFLAGPMAEGGFHVHASLPVPAPSESTARREPI